MKRKEWYIIRKKGETRWTAYEITGAKIKRLLPKYEYKGPFKSLFACLINQ